MTVVKYLDIISFLAPQKSIKSIKETRRQAWNAVLYDTVTI